MIDENKYWEQFIAGGVFVFALYPFTKDLLNEPIFAHTSGLTAQFFAGSIYATFINIPTIAYFLAIFMSSIMILVGRKHLSIMKKKEEINN